MSKIRLSHSLVVLANFLIGSEAIPANEVLDRTELLPRTEVHYRASTPDEMEENRARLAEDSGQTFLLRPSERQLLEQGDDGEWKTFSDDLIEFELPDHPSLRIEVHSPSDNPELNVVGGVVSTADNSFNRVYQITYGNRLPYGLILVTENSWFDDGICLCGPIAMKLFTPVDGTLLETSHLPSGHIKKFQAINDTHRAILFEWTHSAITQQAYARIGSSIRLKPGSSRNEADWIEFTRSRARHAILEGWGWLRKGMTKDEVRSLLGPASTTSRNEMVWEFQERDEFGDGYRLIRRLPFEKGKLATLPEDWEEYVELDPLEGSANWALELAEKWEDEADDSRDWKAPKEDLERIIDAFHKEAPAAVGEVWNRWCEALWELAELGLKDETAIRIVKARFLDRDLPQHYARWALDEYDVPELADLVSDWLEFFYKVDDPEDPRLTEISNLLTSFAKDDPRRFDFVRRGLAHENAEIRGEAVFRVNLLPTDEVKPAIRKALSDPDDDVRRRASYSIDRHFTRDDAEWLRQIAETEKNQDVRKAIENEIENLETQ